MGSEASIDVYKFCTILRHAYYRAFTRAQIESSFRCSGVLPLDDTQPMNTPRRRDIEDDRTLVDAQEMQWLFFEK